MDRQAVVAQLKSWLWAVPCGGGTSLGPYIWLDLRTLEMAEVEIDQTWKFTGWTEDRAIFTRTIKDSRGEELQESIGVSSPFTSDVG